MFDLCILVETKADRCPPEPDPTRPWLFAVGGGLGTSPPDLIRSVAGWAQT